MTTELEKQVASLEAKLKLARLGLTTLSVEVLAHHKGLLTTSHVLKTINELKEMIQ